MIAPDLLAEEVAEPIRAELLLRLEVEAHEHGSGDLLVRLPHRREERVLQRLRHCQPPLGIELEHPLEDVDRLGIRVGELGPQ
eukprot:CAMPEP_0204540372 /NCGR_PEP_ID=MMETSP0661-20131031/17432_1 /ASSEMBLY_ACC=CAM_ASM_000606 /TAXON_ID=109239 /ORGANISM="Alexandrium margalefi, Strain AMGDE01CS-322" /LENGTH=82 /DNA_ID=CAMNT_0051547023 /DNA_START=12 /DNA_END=257 /DNA_ORIENTATION=+